MTYKLDISLQQYIFPKSSKQVQVEVNKGNIHIIQKSLLRNEEIDIELDRINPNTQRIKKWSLMWFFIALFTSLYFLFCVSSWFWNPPLSSHDIGFYMFAQTILLTLASVSWYRFALNSFNLIIFFDKYTNTPLFSLYANHPDRDSCQLFVNGLKKIIVNHEQTRNIQSLLAEIPTHILVEEFSSTYIEELSRRGIDVSALLSFLQKKAINTLDFNNRPSLQ